MPVISYCCMPIVLKRPVVMNHIYINFDKYIATAAKYLSFPKILYLPSFPSGRSFARRITFILWLKNTTKGVGRIAGN